ncbi:MAG TPA: alpha/beta hydrolase family protein [Roseiflexaceae bacterium]|nr:alpha/beta hydrolase family protein [Roseiflexaceae bacterium]HMP40941.1 alpha/beta hydrolase family protein [Roseiflexaceae bacterium]
MQTECFTVEAALAERFERTGRQFGARTAHAAELAAWQSEARSRLRRLIGLDTMQECALDPIIGPLEELDGYTRRRISIAVEPGVRMPIYLLAPADLRPGERRPVLIAPHGHGGGGKATVAGLRDTPARAAAIDTYRYDYGVAFARAGFVTFCPDARGFGERREYTTLATGDELGSSCREINNMAMPLGQTVTGMWVWDLMRLIDYIATRDDCDATRIGCGGLSGGGLQTLWLAALDLRVRCAVVSGYFYGYKESLLHMNQNCSCNYVPGLWQLLDMGDLGALIAPRPLLIESGSRDPLNGASGLANVAAQLAIAAGAYATHHAAEALEHTVFEGEHRWDGAATIPWLQRNLLHV